MRAGSCHGDGFGQETGGQSSNPDSWGMLGSHLTLAAPSADSPRRSPMPFPLPTCPDSKPVMLCSGSIIASDHSPEPLICPETVSNRSVRRGGWVPAQSFFKYQTVLRESTNGRFSFWWWSLKKKVQPKHSLGHHRAVRNTALCFCRHTSVCAYD